MRVNRQKKPYRTLLVLAAMLTPASAISSDLFVRNTEALLTSSKQMTAVFQSADHFPSWYAQLVGQLAGDAQQSDSLTQRISHRAGIRSDKEDEKKKTDQEKILSHLNGMVSQEASLIQNANATFEIISQAAATDETNYQNAIAQKDTQPVIESFARVASWGQTALSTATSYLSRMQDDMQTCTSVVASFVKHDKKSDQPDAKATTNHAGSDAPQAPASVVSDVYNKPSSN